MTTVTASLRYQGVLLRYSRWDALLVTLAMLHGAVLIAFPVAPVIALGVWWNSNTIAHYHIHTPLFRPRRLNTVFALYLSGLLGIPQTIWRERHLAHHAGVAWTPRLSCSLAVESILVLALWGGLLALYPRFFLTVYVPGYLIGLGLCYLHGYYEHARGTMSHHGVLYNLLFFNDGYHVEHHAAPGAHWTALPWRATREVPVSRWPAVLRWLDVLSLEGLERWVLRSPRLQRFLLDRHEQAFRRLLPGVPNVRRVGVVGGGLFPRTLLVLRRVLPQAEVVVIDRSAENLDTARRFLSEDSSPPWVAGAESSKPRRGTVAGASKTQPRPPDCITALVSAPNNDFTAIHAVYHPALVADCDLTIIPLAFVGDREIIYRQPPTAAVLIHDWIWRRRGEGTVVSWLLLKRLNLVTR